MSKDKEYIFDLRIKFLKKEDGEPYKATVHCKEFYFGCESDSDEFAMTILLETLEKEMANAMGKIREVKI